ncbi:MAG TPA: PilZ domain-containing protein [Alphaproteobacteria bacterium]|nr:PilZ domain-containing protein [Alphaproteobacteria bacterium]
MSQTQTDFEENQDRRHFPRASVLWEAAILDGDRADGCVLLNVSENGALLRVLDPFACSTTLNLEIARAGKFAAQVAWRGADAIGVVFKDSPREIAERFKDAALPISAS